MKILCYGDSNTLGYNPQDFFGKPYPHCYQWTSILKDRFGYETINCGVNGRQLPYEEWQYAYLQKLLHSLDADLLLVMLSTNDVLLNIPFEVIQERIRTFVPWLKEHSGRTEPVIILPVPVVAYGETSIHRCEETSRMLRTEAEKAGITTIPADEWNIPLTFDGIHFTAQGHIDFAEKMNEWLNQYRK